ncbi:MAG: nucleoside triphosphate pyrophosphohydrolase [Zymomonas mobilis subsp. pomaceae]|uniref:MazG family protein n=1 Tax=Zymomonas mobilis subsp. pomaceae (strain ATCC 29192 / DSM 22645 / JCM 10191 / CCUG 17912 / NBRC 13757 / NCIMB 11200 / NRRL B-4491 / Barker I) TaxID=579138 RepID=F8EU17_ZYMMT|nr:nucleoside triphosphate pyrophosphohydrolase [Zymomonas mobilis]AEI37097.1 MazG family protein [Zymomonas mobilis subsp. pomaceae ATCC 29192]MDX5948468.1 nucleoside triphosphate pyrophosphohydrolase [Zymomonas mobilis subsp. pomaceae]GEB89467.1 nucleoside triphosphate pyrophosphohydrolase [Zymomonas mobilis subsp. pomaceae]
MSKKPENIQDFLKNTELSPIDKLRTIMTLLRDPDQGCPWDLKQNFASIAPFAIEEAYEVVDAIEQQDMDELKNELGDLLLQVIFHAQMASEQNLFNFDDVVETVCNKMIRRHPHVFNKNTHDKPTMNSDSWEKIKATERADKDKSASGALSGIAKALPALTRAKKIQERAARTGFDWSDTAGPRAKIDEELDEVDNATDHENLIEEIGDVLFTVTTFARHHGIDAEQALKQANAKFESRFRHMEEIAKGDITPLPLAEKEALWQKAKYHEKSLKNK